MINSQTTQQKMHPVLSNLTKDILSAFGNRPGREVIADWHKYTMRATPIGLTVLVKIIKQRDTKKSVILIPESCVEKDDNKKYLMGIVIAVGAVPETQCCQNGIKVDPHCVHVGDMVQFPPYGNVPLICGDDFMVVSESNIIASWQVVKPGVRW